MSLIFVRHGETALNVARTVQPVDTPLSPRGTLQAERVAERLAGAPIEAIISSDLARAAETAQRIAARSGAAIEWDPAWQERNFGTWRGRRWQDIGFDPRSANEAPPDGESLAAFRGRVALAFRQLVARDRRGDGAIVVVSHGLVIRELLERWLHIESGAPVEWTLGNTSVTVAARVAPHAVAVLDCLQHLDGAAQHDPLAAVGL